MEKLVFETREGISEFYVIEQTRLNETDYLLVSESPEEDAEVLIMKDVSARLEKSGEPDNSALGAQETEIPFDRETESVYEFVSDENELTAVLKIFEELLDEEDQ